MKIQVTRPNESTATFDLEQRKPSLFAAQWVVVGVDEKDTPRMLLKFCLHETTRKRYAALWVFGNSPISATTTDSCFNAKGNCLNTIMGEMGYEFFDDGLTRGTRIYDTLMGLAEYEFPNHRYLYLVE